MVAIDAGAVILVSLAICLASEHLLFMTILVPTVLLVRMGLVAAVAERESVCLPGELIFLALCTVVGGFNDWNSVCNRGIYDYTVPHYLSFSTIPVWMLLFWGMILRFMARVCRWERLGPPGTPSDRVGVGRISVKDGRIKVAAELVLIGVTRRMIYAQYLDPVWSWAPFAAALLAALLFLKPILHDFKLMAIVLVAGPAVEILYIQVGHLHTYHLGWIGGVPLWITFWWLLGILVWNDLSLRLQRFLLSMMGGPPNPAQSP